MCFQSCFHPNAPNQSLLTANFTDSQVTSDAQDETMGSEAIHSDPAEGVVD